jgi:hypothetical protein
VIGAEIYKLATDAKLIETLDPCPPDHEITRLPDHQILDLSLLCGSGLNDLVCSSTTLRETVQ